MKRSLGNQMNLFTDMNLCSLFLWRAAYQHSFNLRLVPTAADWTRSVGRKLNVNNDEIFLSRRLRIAASAAEYQSWISFHGLTKKYFTYYSCCIAFLIRSKHQRLNAFRADYCYAITIEWVSEQGLTSPSTHCRSFKRRVFPVNHLHCDLTRTTWRQNT